MIPKLQARGTSFKGACSYVLHDVDASTQERVGWAITRNLVSHPEDAWYEMFETAKAQDMLKAENGIDLRGRKTKPVQHLSLSWDPSDNPTPEHMQETALSCLKALGLSEHEALIVGHTDKDHPHVHIVVNTIHPVTGRTAPLKFSARELSRWAEAYERENGVHCEQRLQNNDDRKVLGEQRDKETLSILFDAARGGVPRDPAPYVPVRDHSPNRRAWMAAEAARSPEDMVANAWRSLTKNESTFTRQDIAKWVNAHTKDRDTYNALFARIEADPELVRLPGDKGRLSTRTMVDTEAAMLNTATTMALTASHGVGDAAKSIEGMRHLSFGQRTALAHVTDRGQLAAVVGYAGSGKSTMLGEAREIWEAAGYSVRGAALAGIAAQGLQDGSGIRSSTVHAMQYAWAQGRETLSPRDIIVIDEAGMIGSRQMQAVLSAVHEAGAKIVLVGDPEQLRPISAGAAFRAIIEQTGAATITDVRRQRVFWQQEATKQLAVGRTTEALQSYAASGAVQGHEDRAGAVKAVVAAWAKDTDSAPDRSALMLGPTHLIVDALNTEARRINRGRGRLGTDMAFEAWDEAIDRPRTTFGLPIAKGEQLMFTKNDNRLGVMNGTIGTLTSIGGGKATLELGGSEGRRVEVDLSTYRNFVYGYAVTLHKSQGATADHVHVVAGRSMDRNLTYVALSRHRDAVSLHYGRDDFPSEAGFGSALSRERSKDTTLDYVHRDRGWQAMSTSNDGEKASLSEGFNQKSEGVPEVDRIRSEMREWRGRNAGRDFGREL